MMQAVNGTDLHYLVDALVAKNGFASHHINSVNVLMDEGLSQIFRDQHNSVFTINMRDVEIKGQGTAGEQPIETIECKVTFGKVDLGRPTMAGGNSSSTIDMMPITARRFDLNYSATFKLEIMVQVTAFYKDGSKKALPEVRLNPPICDLPIMVNSNRCHMHAHNMKSRESRGEDPHDQGGYVIIQGGEWVIDMVESRVFNLPNIFRNIGHEKDIALLEFISKPGDGFENSAEIRIRYQITGQIIIVFNSCSELKSTNIPVHYIFRLFNMTDREMFDNILYAGRTDNSVAAHMFQVLKRAIETRSEHFGDMDRLATPAKMIEAMAPVLVRQMRKDPEYNARARETSDKDNEIYIKKNLLSLIDRYLLPHICKPDGTPDTQGKLRFLAHLIHKLLLVEMQISPSTDRDNIGTKRIFAAGQSISKELKRLIGRFIIKPIRRELNSVFKSANTSFERVEVGQAIIRALKQRNLEKELIKSIISSSRSRAQTGPQKTPLRAEALHRKNQLNTINTVRVLRVAVSGGASRKDERAGVMRRVQPSYDGFICPLQTADTGDEVGIVKQVSILFMLSEASKSLDLCKALMRDPDIIPLSYVWPLAIGKCHLTKIFVNGIWIGCCHIAYQIVRRYREMRRGWLLSDSAELPPPPTGEPTHSMVMNRLTNEERLERILSEKYVHKLTGAKDPRRRIISPYTTIYWDTDSNEIMFWVDQGRALRPVIIVRNNGELDPVGQHLLGSRYDAKGISRSPNSAFKQGMVLTRDMLKRLANKQLPVESLLEDGIIEYIDPSEMMNLLIAQTPEELYQNMDNPLQQYTHCEIHVSILGLPALTAPYAPHDQTPRLTFQTAQSKQTCGWYALNYPLRIDKQAFHQWACEMPLITTIANNYLYPNGQNIIVAITAAPLGNNQEDSVAANTAASQRGLFAGQYFNVFTKILERGESFADPDRNTLRSGGANYENLRHGRVIYGTSIKYGDALLTTISSKEAGAISGSTTVYNFHEPARVEDVIAGTNYLGNTFCKVKVSSVRTFGVGQKFSSRHGQKGMTGAEVQQADMYFTEDGLSPDLIMSSHAIPTRMTIGQLIESLGSTSAALRGIIGDSTVFTPTQLEDIMDELINLGWSSHGQMPVYNGTTGESVDAQIFIGPTYYQRLQKFIEDEMYNATSSNTDNLTRQPREGKKVQGGLRFGEMERDVTMGNGNSTFLMEKFRDDSDGFDIYVCRICQTMPVISVDTGAVFCARCQATSQIPDIVRVKSTWCTKLFLQELEACNVGTLLHVTPFSKEEDNYPSPFPGFHPEPTSRVSKTPDTPKSHATPQTSKKMANGH
jgi:DNA-directed RNA polymerase beta subunit